MSVNRNVSAGVGNLVLLIAVVLAVVAFNAFDVPASLHEECVKQNLPFCETPAAPAPATKTLPEAQLSEHDLDRLYKANERRLKSSSDIGMNTHQK